MAPTIYTLCLLSSAACAWLLIRSFTRTRTRLLLWAAACFVLLALNNLLVVVDLVLTGASVDLGLIRQLCSLAAVSILLYGFIWELD
jgi:Family of unknown function (DUF5985)